MYLNYRHKNASTINLNSSDVCNSSRQDSRNESSSSKRFNRKQTNPLDNSRTCRTPKNVQTQLKKHLQIKKSNPIDTKKINYVSSGFIRQEDLFLKLTSTPSKSCLYTPPISTDRGTQATVHRYPDEGCLHEGRDIRTEKKRNCSDLEEELELKAGEIMMLQDENIKLKGEISSLESEHLKLRLSQQKQHKETVKKLNDQIETLKKELQDKNQQIKQFKKNEAALNREIKGVKYDKLLIEKQIEQIYKKKLSKDLRDLMSYRELSLMKQVQELKEELGKQKTQKQKDMEAQIARLKQKDSQKDNIIRRLEVKNHTLSKKNQDVEEQIRFQTEQFGRCFTDLKQTNESLMSQLKKVRKENLRLRKVREIIHSGSRKSSLALSEDEDTVSFTLSPRQS